MLNTITMIELLEKFDECDTFSLTGSIENVIITSESKNFALDEIKKINRTYLLEYYNKLKDQYSFIPFDDLYNEIEKECIDFEITQKDIYMKKYGFFDNSFICDCVMSEKNGKRTKYTEPEGFFWHFYHLMGQNLDRKLYVEKLNNNKLNAIDKIKDNLLKKNLIKYEILFHNHCTESGSLMINYYFKLNEETKKWLLQFKNDFAIEGELDDLAFYKNDEIKFSSCTHEKFNSLN